MTAAKVVMAVVAAAALAVWMVADWQVQGGVYSDHGETTVIAPGHKLADEEVSISGTDECPTPPALAAKLFGLSWAGSKDCIVLSPDRKAVAVTVKGNASETRETWTVRWQGTEARLFRPNGDIVRLVAAS